MLARVATSALLSTAEDRVAAAEGKLRALGASAAAGRSVVPSRDDPTLANLEQRASQMREELRETRTRIHVGLSAKDPKVIPTRPSRGSSNVRSRATYGVPADGTPEAQEDLASSQAAAARIRHQMAAAARKQRSSRALQRVQIQQLRSPSAKSITGRRAAASETRGSERAACRRPRCWKRPPHPNAVSSALLARHPDLDRRLARAGFANHVAVELFNRRSRDRGVLIQPQSGALPHDMSRQILSNRGPPAVSLGRQNRRYCRTVAFPRKLRHDEIAALSVLRRDSRLVMRCFERLHLEEAVKLRWSDVDLAGARFASAKNGA